MKSKFYIMKKLVSVVMLFFMLQKSTVGAFGDITHRALTEGAVGCTGFLNVFSSQLEKDNMWECLEKSCVIPDVEETDGGTYSRHFYNFNEGCFDFERPNAMSSMYEHFKEATRLWSIDRSKSIDELGRAIHYMQDMCCVVHLLGRFNITQLHLMVHGQYEAIMDSKAKLYLVRAALQTPAFDFRSCSKVDVRSMAAAHSLNASEKFMGISDILVKTSAHLIYRIFVKEVDDRLSENATKFEDFENAYQATCKLIYLFCEEVGIAL